MNIGSLQDYLTTQKVNTNSNRVMENKSISSFPQILSEVCGTGNNVDGMFQAAFPTYTLQTKVGNCNVSWESWDRNDFPIWEYFKKETKADCLNNWKAAGPEPPQQDPSVQRGLRQIKNGEMVMLMTETLQKKIESDPEFAEDVLNKVQKWKEDYDREDNAIAASLGYDPELNQLSKSYCIQLDENGNVGDHTVIGEGLDDPHSDETIIIGPDNDKPVYKRVERQTVNSAVNNEIISESSSIDFESVAPVMMEYRMKKK